MKASVASLIRDDVRAMQAYVVQDASGFVKLDAMENPFQLPHNLQQELAEQLAALAVNRYPAPRAPELVKTLRRVAAIPNASAVMLGNGSDELIGIVAQALARPGASVLAPVPTFVMYDVYARLAGLAFTGVPLKADFTLDMTAMLAAIDATQPAVIYLAYPNNPTGNLFDRAQMLAILQAAPGLVIVDEAYQPFAQTSFLDQLPAFENLLILRTLSKSGLAGARLGYLVGAPHWIEQFDKVRPPYNVNVLTQCYARFALEHGEILDAQAQMLRSERTALIAALSARDALEVFPTQANFILFRVRTTGPDASAVFDGLKARRILVKNLSQAHPLLHGCLRVTVSTAQENALFLDALDAALCAPSALS